MGRVSDQPLLGRTQLEGDTKNGGIVLIGSHVKKTTDQLNCLKELEGQADFMEFQVNTVFEENGLEKEVERTVKAAEEKNSVWQNRCNLYKQTASCPGEYDSGRKTADFRKDFQCSDKYYWKAFCETQIHYCQGRNHILRCRNQGASREEGPCYGAGEKRNPGVDDRGRKQIPGNALYYFPWKRGGSCYVERNCRRVDLN